MLTTTTIEERFAERSLVSNGYTLSLAPTRLGWLQPTDPALPISQLRELYAAQGYLWLKGIVGRERALAFRRRFFAAFERTGLLEPGTDPAEGIYGREAEARGLARDAWGEGGEIHRIWMEAVRWPEYEALCAAPPIVRFYEAFFGGAVQMLKRKIIRFTTPGGEGATAGHYDLVYLRAGTDQICSSWIPVGDTPVEMGGLLYLEGSDAVGRRMEAEFSQRNAELPPEERISAYNRNMLAGGWVSRDLPALAEKFATRWLIADYEAGDMVVHSPYMIHAATDNGDPARRIRLSTDIRYQRAADQADPRWNNDWFTDDHL